MHRSPLVGAIAALALGILSGSAQAAFPGANGEIAFTTGSAPSSISTINPDRTNEQPLRTDGSAPAYSADGKRIAFVDSDGVLWTADADGGNAAPVTLDAAFPGAAEDPTWAPDGHQIAFARRLDIPEETGSSWVMTVDLSTHVEHQVTPDLGADSTPDPSWSPDGRLIAYSVNTNTSTSAIHVIAPNGTGDDPITSTPGLHAAPDWSPDGKMIAYLQGTTVDAVQLVVANADGTGTPQDSLPAPAFVTHLAWAPDGTQIAYEDDSDESSTISLATPADPSAEQTFVVNGSDPAWRPIDVVPPVISLAVPADGGQYQQDIRVLSRYSCSDPRPRGSGVVVSCVGTRPTGTPIDTTSLGTHVFTVTARDRMGNTSVLRHSYTVFAPPPPITMILSGPPARTVARTATFTFTADKMDATFSCRLDSGPWGACSGDNTHVVRRLSLGKHTFSVRASDAAGVDAHPPTRRWTVVPRLLSKRTFVFGHFQRQERPREFVLFTSLVAHHVPARAVIRGSCAGRGCGRRHRSWSTRRARTAVDLTGWLHGRELRPGARLNVVVAKAGFRGKGKLYCIRHLRRVLVIPYTVGKPHRTCSG